WKLRARFTAIEINGPVALGAPGCLAGPSLEDLIAGAPSLGGLTATPRAYADAAAAGVARCFGRWQDQGTVPGLPRYPAFAACPAPVAPPMPNIPMPLSLCLSGAQPDITVPGALKDAMLAALAGDVKRAGDARQQEALFAAIESVLCLAFQIWLPLQL